MDYTDSDLTFYLVVYKDLDRAKWCVKNLRLFYPKARVVIESDGDDDPGWEDLRTDHGCEVYFGERLFEVSRGADIVSRMINRHLDDHTLRRWLIRIDTDTEIRRRFHAMPNADYCGHRYPERDFIQGGCIILTRRFCRLVKDSGALDNRQLGEDTLIWRKSPKIAKDRVESHGLTSLDWLINWAASEIGIKGHHFEEVVSRWKKPVPRAVDCAVAHPCKDIPVDRPI